jgi:hypothetical protein
LLRFLFASLRGVSQSLLEEFHSRKAVAQSFLQSGNVLWLRHEENTVPLLPTSVVFQYLRAKGKNVAFWRQSLPSSWVRLGPVCRLAESRLKTEFRP